MSLQYATTCSGMPLAPFFPFEEGAEFRFRKTMAVSWRAHAVPSLRDLA